MPIVGALGVIKRIEDVMQERFESAVRLVEESLIADGGMSSSDPVCPIPPSDAYFRQEEGAFDRFNSVVTRVNDSVVVPTQTAFNKAYWTHEVVVEVHKTLDNAETFEDLHSMIYRYGAALVSLFGTTSPLLELGDGSSTTTSYAFPDTATAEGASWADPGNITATDASVATWTKPGDSTREYLDANFSLSSFGIPGGANITGAEVRVKAAVDAGTGPARILEIDVVGLRGVGTSDTETLTFGPAYPTMGTLSVSGFFTHDLAVPVLPITNSFSVRVTPSAAIGGDVIVDSVELRLTYEDTASYTGTIAATLGPVRYRDRFDEAGAFLNRSASVVMEVERREIND